MSSTDNKRATNYHHITIVELEAFGIFKPPASRFSQSESELLLMAFEKGLGADFSKAKDYVTCSRLELKGCSFGFDYLQRSFATIPVSSGVQGPFWTNVGRGLRLNKPNRFHRMTPHHPFPPTPKRNSPLLAFRRLTGLLDGVMPKCTSPNFTL